MLYTPPHSVLTKFACVLALLLPVHCWAQGLPDAGTLLDQTKNIGAPVPGIHRPDTPVLDKPVRPVMTMPEGLTVTVSAFKIIGAVSYTESELAPLVSSWLGKTLDVNGLNEAAGAITRYYQSHGHFLTYAYLPAQKVADGVIELAVMEGRLENVEVATAQDVRLQDEVIQAHVGDLTEAKTVTQPEMERRLLLLNDIPGVVARAAFTPGTATGSADMVVSVAEDEPLSAQLELNNHGSRPTGEYMLGASFHFKDLFGVGDSTRAGMVASNTGNVVNSNLSTSVPVGGKGWTVGAGISRLSYQLGTNFSALGGIGQATVLSVNTGYPLIRSFSRNLDFQASLSAKKLKDEIQLTAVINPKNSNVLKAGFNFNQKDQFLGGGSVAASVNLSQGRLTLGDSLQQANDLAGLQTAGNYSKLGFDFSRQQAIYGSWSMLAHLAGQQASKNLDSTEKMALTGPYAVRAYAVGDATVDKGSYASLELRYTLDYVGGVTVMSLFHDQGWGSYNLRPLAGVTGNTVHLYGTGLGVQWMGGEDFGLNASFAWHGKQAPASTGGNTNPNVYFQLYYKL